MAFEPETSKIPVGIGHTRVILEDDAQGGQMASFELAIMFDDGMNKGRRGDLLPHLTITEKIALRDFMVMLRARAEEQILPP